jgi:hypothetical protein
LPMQSTWLAIKMSPSRRLAQPNSFMASIGRRTKKFVGAAGSL